MIFRSKQHLTWFKKKSANKKCTMWIEGDSDITIVFDEKILDFMTDCLKIIKKRKIFRRHQRLLIERIKHAREAR